MRIVRFSDADAPRITAVLCEAFAGYPVMRFVLGDEDGERLARLIGMFVLARVYRGEPLLGVNIESRIAAVAIASHPGGGPSPEAFRALRAEVWRELGAAAEARYDAYGEGLASFPFDFPHVHLNMVGVLPSFRGRGLARLLIDEVQRISMARPESRGVTLTTEDPANVPFYEKLGFEVVGRAHLAPDLESWGFFRPDPP